MLMCLSTEEGAVDLQHFYYCLNIHVFLTVSTVHQGGVGIETKELGSNFLLTGSRLNQPANIIRHISNLGNDDVI